MHHVVLCGEQTTGDFKESTRVTGLNLFLIPFDIQLGVVTVLIVWLFKVKCSAAHVDQFDQ